MITALKLARMNRGLTQKKVGELAGVHSSIISAVEARRLVTGAENRKAIVKIVGGSERDFFDERTGLAL